MRFLKEVRDDLNFIKSHSLQPQWYKVLKVFIIVGVLIAYYYLFGFFKIAIFFAAFLFLGLLVHLIYRVMTNKWRHSWLDFVVVETKNGTKPESIGKFYYLALTLNTLISVMISQMMSG